MLRSRLLVAPLTLACLSLFEAEAAAVYPHADCAEFAGTGVWTSGWAFMVSTATLEALQGGDYSAIDQVTTSDLLPTGGPFLLDGGWTATPGNGTHRARLAVTAYVGGTGTTPPTQAQLDAWPTNQIFHSTTTGSTFLCGTGRPTITSTPPSAATVGALYAYAPTVNYGGSFALSFQLLAAPTTALTIDASGGEIEWTPTVEHVGTRYVIFRVSAANGLFDVQAYAPDVSQAAQNRTPSAIADEYAATEDTTLTVLSSEGVLTNDIDPDGDPLSVILVMTTSHGILTLTSTGGFTYSPDPDFEGLDSFSYRASDGAATSSTVTVALEVAPVADAPIATDDTRTLDEDQELTVPALSGVLANDIDADGDSLVASLVVGPSHGTLALASSGAYVYAPNPEYVGTDTFTYEVSDGALTATATATLTIRAVNDAPTAVADSYALDEGGELQVQAPVGLLANDSDPEDDVLAILPLTQPRLGALLVDALGAFTYVPFAGVSGTDTFVYVAVDQHTFSNVATVNLEIAPQQEIPENRPPIFESFPPISTLVGANYSYAVDAIDPDEDALTLTLIAGPSAMTLVGATVSWVADEVGEFTVTIEASDGRGGKAIQSFSLTVFDSRPPDLLPTVIDTSALATDATTLVTIGSVFVTTTNEGGGCWTRRSTSSSFATATSTGASMGLRSMSSWGPPVTSDRSRARRRPSWRCRSRRSPNIATRSSPSLSMRRRRSTSRTRRTTSRARAGTASVCRCSAWGRRR